MLRVKNSAWQGTLLIPIHPDRLALNAVKIAKVARHAGEKARPGAWSGKGIDSIDSDIRAIMVTHPIQQWLSTLDLMFEKALTNEFRPTQIPCPQADSPLRSEYVGPLLQTQENKLHPYQLPKLHPFSGLAQQEAPDRQTILRLRYQLALR